MIKKIKLGKFQGGLTLVEMLVVVSIVVLITLVVLGNYPLFSSQFGLSRVSREIALEIKQAQVYGVGVRNFPASDEIYPPYGLHITPTVSSPFETISFADYCNNDPVDNCDVYLEENRHGDGLYQDFGNGCDLNLGDTECLSKLIVTKDVELESVCVEDSNQSQTCWDNSGSGSLTRLDITFRRPDPEAIIKINNDESTVYTKAIFLVRSARYPEKKKYVRVWITGQISVLDYIPE